MKHSVENFNKTEIEIFKTNRPLNFYLMTIAVSGLFVLLLLLTLIRQLPVVDVIICFFLFSSILYLYFGRYLATIRLYRNRLEVQYIFAWNNSIVYTFNSLSFLENRNKPWLTQNHSLYTSYQWLYLKNDKDEVCQIRYNIDNRKNEEFINQLNKLISKKCFS